MKPPSGLVQDEPRQQPQRPLAPLRAGHDHPPRRLAAAGQSGSDDHAADPAGQRREQIAVQPVGAVDQGQPAARRAAARGRRRARRKAALATAPQPLRQRRGRALAGLEEGRVADHMVERRARSSGGSARRSPATTSSVDARSAPRSAAARPASSGCSSMPDNPASGHPRQQAQGRGTGAQAGVEHASHPPRPAPQPRAAQDRSPPGSRAGAGAGGPDRRAGSSVVRSSAGWSSTRGAAGPPRRARGAPGKLPSGTMRRRGRAPIPPSTLLVYASARKHGDAGTLQHRLRPGEVDEIVAADQLDHEATPERRDRVRPRPAVCPGVRGRGSTRPRATARQRTPKVRAWETVLVQAAPASEEASGSVTRKLDAVRAPGRRRPGPGQRDHPRPDAERGPAHPASSPGT